MAGFAYPFWNPILYRSISKAEFFTPGPLAHSGDEEAAEAPGLYKLHDVHGGWTAPGRQGRRCVFVKNIMHDGVIYHIRNADIDNMRILSEPAEAIDRYCEHMLLKREGHFDFLPYTSPM